VELNRKLWAYLSRKAGEHIPVEDLDDWIQDMLDAIPSFSVVILIIYEFRACFFIEKALN